MVPVEELTISKKHQDYTFGTRHDNEKTHLFIAGTNFQSTFDIYSPCMMEITVHEDGSPYTYFDHENDQIDNLDWLLTHLKDFECAFANKDNYINFISYAINELHKNTITI